MQNHPNETDEDIVAFVRTNSGAAISRAILGDFGVQFEGKPFVQLGLTFGVKHDRNGLSPVWYLYDGR